MCNELLPVVHLEQLRFERFRLSVPAVGKKSRRSCIASNQLPFGANETAENGSWAPELVFETIRDKGWTRHATLFLISSTRVLLRRVSARVCAAYYNPLLRDICLRLPLGHCNNRITAHANRGLLVLSRTAFSLFIGVR